MIFSILAALKLLITITSFIHNFIIKFAKILEIVKEEEKRIKIFKIEVEPVFDHLRSLIEVDDDI